MAEISVTKEHLAQLEGFVELYKSNPKILTHPDLAFFKHYIESLGGKISSFPQEPTSPKTEIPSAPKEPEPEIESEESDIELDNSGVIEPDKEEPQPMGDADKEVSEEDMEKSDEKKREAIKAFATGDFEKAAGIYTEAILLNPGSALLYAKRGQCFLKMNKPNACIRDCSRALQINPDNAAAYKFRGRAHRLLGKWEEAAHYLRNACKIDFDEQADEWLKEVTPNARKLEEHRIKYERKRAEKEMKEKLERVRRVREELAKEAQQSEGDSEGTGAGTSFINKLRNDPEIVAALQDPEVSAAFDDIYSCMMEKQNNPKFSVVVKQITTMLGGDMPGWFGAMGDGFPAPTSGASPSGDDVGLN